MSAHAVSCRAADGDVSVRTSCPHQPNTDGAVLAVPATLTSVALASACTFLLPLLALAVCCDAAGYAAALLDECQRRRVALHDSCMRMVTLCLAGCASKAVRRLQRRIAQIRRVITCFRIPDVASLYAALICRRAAVAVCTVSGVPRRACVVKRA